MRYEKEMVIAPADVKKRTELNRTAIQEYIRFKKEGPTLKQKIEQHYLNPYEVDGHITIISDSFFKPEVEESCEFYIRRYNFHNHSGYIHNVVDSEGYCAKEEKKAAELEAKKDLTY